MKRIRKLLPLLFATTLIAGAIALASGLASAAPNCTGTVNKKALCHAQEQVGKKCTWNPKEAKTPDCARITYDAYRKAGLKRNYLSASASYNQGVKSGWTVPVKDRKAGDLLFFDSAGRGVDRVGIYAGNGKMVFATGTPSSTKSGTVKLTELTAARIKQLTKQAVRPVVADPKAKSVKLNNAMAVGDTTDLCPEPEDGAADENEPENEPEGDTGTPEGDSTTPEDDTTPDGDTANPDEDTANPDEDTANPDEDTATPEGDSTDPADDAETSGGDTTTTSGTTTTTTRTANDGTTTTTTTTTGGDTTGEPDADADNTETEPGADADSPEGGADADNPEGGADGDASCRDTNESGTEGESTTDGESTTEPADDCTDTDVVDNKIVIIDPSDVLDDKPGVVEPAAAGDNGTGTNREEVPCVRP